MTASTGPKISCAGDDMIRLDVGKEARLAPEPLLRQRTRVRPMHGGSFFGALGQIAIDRRELRPGVDGAHIGVLVEWITDSERPKSTLQLLDDFGKDGLLNEEPTSCATDMALVEPDALDDSFDRLIDGRVGEDDVRTLPAEFEGESFSGACGRCGDPLPDVGRTGEGDLVDVRVLNQQAAGIARSGHDVDHTRREFALLADLREAQCGQWRGLGWFEDHRVATSQSRGDLPGEHEEWEIPRDHLGADPQRLRFGRPGKRVLELVTPSGMVEEVLGDERDVHIAAFADGLSTVHRLEHRQLPRSLLNSPSDAVEVLGPLLGLRPRPFPKGGSSGFDGGIDVGGIRLVAAREDVFRRWIDRFERLPSPAGDEATADEQAMPDPRFRDRLVPGRARIPIRGCLSSNSSGPPDVGSGPRAHRWYRSGGLLTEGRRAGTLATSRTVDQSRSPLSDAS